MRHLNNIGLHQATVDQDANTIAQSVCGFLYEQLTGQAKAPISQLWARATLDIDVLDAEDLSGTEAPLEASDLGQSDQGSQSSSITPGSPHVDHVDAQLDQERQTEVPISQMQGLDHLQGNYVFS